MIARIAWMSVLYVALVIPMYVSADEALVEASASAEPESTPSGKVVVEELQRRVSTGAIDAALDLLSETAPSEERDAGMAILVASPAYQSRYRKQQELQRRALEAARAGKIDIARALFGAASVIRTASALDEQGLTDAIASLEVPDLTPPPGATSSQMTLNKFAPRWANVMAGREDLDFELAEYAKSIAREKLCGSYLDPFERADCAKYQQVLRKAINEGFRRRVLVGRPRVFGEYTIEAAKWKMSVPLNGFGDQMFGIGSPFQLETPKVCRMFCGGTMLCQERERVERFTIAMPASEARGVVKTYPDRFTATVAAEIVREGAHRLTSCGSNFEAPTASLRPFYVYRIIGVRVTDGAEQVWATGIYK